MNVFDLVATLSLDTSGYDEGLNESESKAGKFGKGVMSALGTTAKVAAGAVAAGGAAVVGITKQATDAYASYEQLVGGVETLFGDSADAVKEHADNAFKSAGMSVNDYMETVTSFSASLIQATGRGEQQDIDALKASLEESVVATKRSLEDQYNERKKYWDDIIRGTKDANEKASLKAQKEEELKELKRANADQITELKAHNEEQIKLAEAANSTSTTTAESLERAAELADMAIIDMSDNANKMGTSMEAIQNAYQGFAKQNYTMLDNLKLGYGGTKEEMERLMQDAEKISGVKYDVSSYADIVEAIHQVQTEMGITGTTSKEAASTIEGSAASMKAAWQNFITGLGRDDADLGKLFDEFITAFLTNLEKNIVPRISTILKGISSALVTAIPKLMKELPKLLKAVVPDLMKAIKSLISSLAKMLKENSKDIVKGVIDFVMMLVDVIIDNLPTILEALIEITIGLLEGIADKLPELIPKLLAAIGIIVGALVEHLPDILGAVIKALFALLGSLGVELGKMFGAFFETVGEWFSDLWDSITSVFEPVTDFFKNLFEDAWLLIKGAFDAAGQWFSDLWNDIKEPFEAIGTGIADFFGPLFEGAWDTIVDLWEGAGDWFATIWEGIKAVFAPVGDFFKNIGEKARRAFLGPLEDLIDIIGMGQEGFDDFVQGIYEEAYEEMAEEEMSKSARNASSGDTNVNVYIGEEAVDDAYTRSENRQDFRSGGRR